MKSRRDVGQEHPRGWDPLDTDVMKNDSIGSIITYLQDRVKTNVGNQDSKIILYLHTIDQRSVIQLKN